MSIASTFSKVADGSEKLLEVHNRIHGRPQTAREGRSLAGRSLSQGKLSYSEGIRAKDIGNAMRCASPVERVMASMERNMLISSSHLDYRDEEVAKEGQVSPSPPRPWRATVRNSRFPIATEAFTLPSRPTTAYALPSRSLPTQRPSGADRGSYYCDNAYRTVANTAKSSSPYRPSRPSFSCAPDKLRPGTAYAPRRAARLAAAEAASTTNQSPPMPELVEVEEADGLVLRDDRTEIKARVAVEIDPTHLEHEGHTNVVNVADDELLEALEAAYNKLRRDRVGGGAEVGEGGARSESKVMAGPIEGSPRLGDATPKRGSGSLRSPLPARPLTPTPLDGSFRLLSEMEELDADELLTLSWGCVELSPTIFLQEVKRRCCVGEAASAGIFRQCEAIVWGLRRGELSYDLAAKEGVGEEVIRLGSSSAASPSGGLASLRPDIYTSHDEGDKKSNASRFLQSFMQDFTQNVMAAIRECVILNLRRSESYDTSNNHLLIGLDDGRAVRGWSKMLERLWLCVLLHLRVAFED